MRAWWSVLACFSLVVGCTANDGTERSSFYGDLVARGGGSASGGAGSGCQSDAECAPERCFSGQCYPIVTCEDSLDCYNNAPPPLTICDSATGQCVVCVSNSDCAGLGSSCVNNDCR